MISSSKEWSHYVINVNHYESINATHKLTYMCNYGLTLQDSMFSYYTARYAVWVYHAGSDMPRENHLGSFLAKSCKRKDISFADLQDLAQILQDHMSRKILQGPFLQDAKTILQDGFPCKITYFTRFVQDLARERPFSFLLQGFAILTRIVSLARFKNNLARWFPWGGL